MNLAESESNKVGEMQLDFKYGSDKLWESTNSTFIPDSLVNCALEIICKIIFLDLKTNSFYTSLEDSVAIKSSSKTSTKGHFVSVLILYC